MVLMRVSKRSGGIRLPRKGTKMRRQSVYRFSNAGRQYLKTILNPSHAGAKIPDSFGAKTCTLQLQREVKIDAHLISATQYGCGGLMQISVAPFAWTSEYDALNTTGYWGGGAFVEGADLYASCKMHTLMRTARVVSAGLKVQFTGTTQNDKGTITVFAVDRPHIATAAALAGGIVGNPDFYPFAFNASPVGVTVGSRTSAISGASLRNLPVNAFGPVRQGCVARYFPVDDTDLQFHPVPPSSAGNDAIRTGTVGALGFFCEGVDAGASLIVQFTVNLECTVKDDSFHLVSTESSPVDSNALARCALVYLKKPQVRVGGSMGDTESINVYSR